MDVRELLKELPLAEAALALLGHVAGVKELSELYDQHRGRSYQKKLSFPDLFQVVVEALVQHQGRGRQAFERSVERDEISCSIQAVFGKLRRVPLPLSQAVLSDCTDRVRALYPAEQVTSPVPASLQAFHIVIIDAKTLKRVARRLKCLQGLKVGVLGGKVLAVLDGTTGLVLAFTAHPDGDSSDLPLLPDALPLARQRLPGTRLFIADRNFCDLLQMARFTEEGDHFVLRHHQKVLFYSDTMAPTLVPSAIRQDRFGRAYTDEWGWTGSPKRSDRCYVRRILLERPGEKPIALLTDLIDAHAYPATDILEIYLQRWGIERVFQQLSDVFGLLQLMGCTPLASIFQASLCMLLYNVLQVLRAHVAVTHQRQPRTLSPEQIFIDLRQQIMIVRTLSSLDQLREAVPTFDTSSALKEYLNDRLSACWSKRWGKAPPRHTHRPPTVLLATPLPQTKRRGGHTSVYREMQKVRAHKAVATGVA